MAWTEKDIKALVAAGKVKSYKVIGKGPAAKGNKLPAKKSKALLWLAHNLHYWSIEKNVKIVLEHRFDDVRKWRFDFAIIEQKIAVEFEGGIYQPNSGHKTAKHYTKDTDKYNRATVLGWRVIRVTALNYKTVLSQLNELI